MQHYPLHNLYFTRLTLICHFQQELKRWFYYSFLRHIDLPEYGHGDPEKHTAMDSYHISSM